MTPRTGRPPSDNPRRHVRSVHLTDNEDALITAAAKAAGKPVTAWIREKAVAAAKRLR